MSLNLRQTQAIVVIHQHTQGIDRLRTVCYYSNSLLNSRLTIVSVQQQMQIIIMPHSQSI